MKQIPSLVILLFLVFLGGCNQAEVVNNGVTYTKPADSDHNIDLAGYEFDLPEKHDRFGTAGFNNQDVLQEFELNYRASESLDIPEAKTAKIRLFVDKCSHYSNLVIARRRGYLSNGYIAGILPRIAEKGRLSKEGFTVANKAEVVMEFIYEHSNDRARCLVVSTSIKKKSDLFHLSKMGDLEGILESILESVRRD